MKAVILAGGDGTRLRPLSLHRPKPMMPLFGKPVLEHTVDKIRRAGITDILTTLRAMPHLITDYFGDGSRFGVNMTHFTEKRPLGTAGAVRACSEQLGGETFLVASGDGVFDIDLRAAINFHASRAAAVTLVLKRVPDPTVYGVVMTDRNGRVTRFDEKPPESRVFSDTANTGIYVISPGVIERIKPGTFCDFARDLFPKLLAEGVPMFGYAADGYWCDIGDADAYRRCAFDALDGKLSLLFTAKRIGRAAWSDSPIPVGAQVTEPVYIASGVTLAPGSRIGPYAVLGADCALEEGAVVERSVLDGAKAGAHSDICGAILCRGVTVEGGARVREGCVLGEGVSVGAHAMVAEGSRVWPGKEIEEGALVSGSLSGWAARRLLFEDAGKLSGQPNVDLTPDVVLRLGAACAAAADGGDISVSWQGGDAARMIAQTMESGINAAGRGVAVTDAAFAAAAAYAANVYKFPMSIFVTQRHNNVNINIFGADGLPLERSRELNVESVAARGEVSYRETRSVGGSHVLGGVTELYEIAAAAPPVWQISNRSRVRVPEIMTRGGSVAGQSLYNVIHGETGAARGVSGGIMLEIDESGFFVTAIDENENYISHEKLLAAMVLFEVEMGLNRVAVPYNAPMFLDALSERGAEILRAGRDRGAEELLAAQPFMRDGIFLAARLKAAMSVSGKTLAELVSNLPAFASVSADLPIEHSGGSVLRALADAAPPERRELRGGLRVREGDGWVRVAPMPGRRALRITGEGADEEIAAELCASFRRKAIEVDRKL